LKIINNGLSPPDGPWREKEFLFMRFQTLTIVASFVGLGLMASTAIHAATVCVDPGKPTCEATIQDGVDAAVAGDTVSITKGDFLEGVVIPAGKDGLIIKGKGSVIDSATTGLPGIEVLSSGVAISNLTVRNADGNGIDIGLGADGVEITRVRVQNADSDCIETDGHDTVIEKNTLVACGSYIVDATADDVIIRRLPGGTAARDWVVVTDDRGLQARARDKGASIRTLAEWSSKKTAPPPKPRIESKLSSHEVAQWEEFFADGSRDEDDSRE